MEISNINFLEKLIEQYEKLIAEKNARTKSLYVLIEHLNKKQESIFLRF